MVLGKFTCCCTEFGDSYTILKTGISMVVYHDYIRRIIQLPAVLKHERLRTQVGVSRLTATCTAPNCKMLGQVTKL